MLEIKNLSYSVVSKPVLKDINLSLKPGKIIGLFGENGAGKSSLMKCILGYVPYSGDVLLDGENITAKNIARIAFGTCEHSFFPDLTAREHLSFLKDMFPNFSLKRFNGLLDFFNLSINQEIGKMSIGQQNQFETIMALSQGADYILLDEPFSANDLLNREDFYKMILGILDEHETILLATHLIEEVSGFIDRAILIKNGRIVGNLTADEIEESGISLTDHIKKNCRYEADRVAKAVTRIAGED